MKQVRPLILPLALLAAAALPLAAQEQPYVRRGEIERQGPAWTEELHCSAPVQAGGRLLLRADQGSVRIVPGRDDILTCRVRLRAHTKHTGDEEEARRLLRSFELILQPQSANALLLRGRSPGSPLRLKVDYEISLPRRFHADLETQGGDLQVETLEGELRGVTAGGNIRTGDVLGPVRAVTAGGNITVGTIGQRLEARTAGGNIRAGDIRGNAVLETSGGEITAGVIGGSLRAVTAGGDIILRGAAGDMVVQTAGGQIRVGEAGASLRAETAGGSIEVDAVRGPVEVNTAGGCIFLDRVNSAVQAATVAGSVRALITANADSFGASLLQTSFGDLEVYLPPDLPLTIDAAIQNASGHKIVSDFPLDIRGASGYQVQTVQGHGALNGGGVVLRLRTTAGNIEIRKLDLNQMEKLDQRRQQFWRRLLEQYQRQQQDDNPR